MESTGPESMEYEDTEYEKAELERNELTEAEKELLKTLHLESVFVTGANRGLGLEFVRQLVKLPNPPSFVFATYREQDSTTELLQIKENWRTTTNVQLVKMDVTNVQTVKDARDFVKDKLKDKGLTMLINNAGVAEILYFPQLSEQNMMIHFDVNSIGPVIVMEEFLDLLKLSASRMQGKLSASRSVVLNICAWGASIEGTGMKRTRHLSVGSCKMSKAALNMAMRLAALQVERDGILVVMMCPGWVRTDMGTQRAYMSTEESVLRIFATLTKLGDEHQGLFMNRFGRKQRF